MLQANRETVGYEPAEEATLVDLLRHVSSIVRQQLPIILAITILTSALGALYVYLTPPTFTARAAIIIDRGKVQAQLGEMLRELRVDSIEVDGQIQLIKSEAVALAVVDKLSLADDPEFIGPPVGVPGLLQKLLLALRSHDRPNPPFSLREAAAATVATRITVNRVGGSVIEIEAFSLAPERAAQIANAFAECYFEDQLMTRFQMANQAAGWLKERIKELGDQSGQAEEAVVQFKVRNNIVTAGVGGRLLTEQQLGELNTQLNVAREKAAETRARLDRIEAIINSDASDDKVVGTVAETLNNPIIVKLRSQLLELAGREADWSRRFGRDHLAVTNLERQMREIRNSITDELRRIAETYKSDYAIAKQRQTNLEKTVADAVARFQETNQAQIELRQLESSADTYRSLYKSAVQRSRELVQQQSFPGTEARLITRASKPDGKSAPKSTLILLVSSAGGFLMGLGVGSLRVTLDRVFRTQGQVEAVLQASCLALAPTLRARPRRKAPQPVGARSIVPGISPSWEVIERPLARFSEAMRYIKSAAALNSPPIKVLGFTSSLPSEGKSTLATALSLLASQGSSRVLLVDCDLRHPALSDALAPGAEYGILDVTSGKKQFEDVVWTDATTNLSFLPGTVKAPIPGSADILASEALRSLFEKLRERYDYVVVDLPPVAPIVDVRSTAGLVDAYVFVVEWGKTKMEVVDLALRKTPAVYENLLGVVLNKVDFKALGKYDGRRSDYFSDKYYAQYGDPRR